MSASEDLINDFCNEVCSLQMDLQDMKSFCSRYENIRSKYIWITKDGKKIQLGNMPDSYLDNLISFIKKKAPQNYWNAILAQEYKYRKMKSEIQKISNSLSNVQGILDSCL